MIESSARHSAGLPKMTTKCTNGGCKPNMSQCTPGAGFSWLMRGKAPPEMPAFQPYRGKPAVRNDRESRGNDGIIRSPGSRLDSTRLRGVGGNAHPYRDSSTTFEHGMIDADRTSCST